jgi:hypothetical protein
VVELVDTLHLGCSAARREGSSPTIPTVLRRWNNVDATPRDLKSLTALVKVQTNARMVELVDTQDLKSCEQ